MISTPPVLVATAVSDRYEAALVSGLDGEAGVRVVRRCADVADVLACAAAGLVQAVVVSADLRGLDAVALELLEHHGCGVVALVDGAPDELPGHERRLRQSGVGQVLSAAAGPAQVAAAARTAVALSGAELSGAEMSGRGTKQPRGTAGLADPRSPASRRVPEPVTIERSDGELTGCAPPGATAGRVVTVWGPVGAPGRTTVAVELAAELATSGQQVLLVDADTYGASIAQRLALLDESAAIVAACRAADRGRLDHGELVRLAPVVLPRLRVLTGLLRAERWPEVRATALSTELQCGRSLADWVLVDTGFSLEQDEELAYDTVAPRRNQATLASLAEADVTVVVGGADPVGLQRLVRAVRDLADLPERPAGRPVVVANRLRAAAVGPRPARQVREVLQRYAGIDDVLLLPDDPQALDAAVLAGRTLAEHARSSPARAAVHDLAMTVRRHVEATADGAEPLDEAAAGVPVGAH
ncbi:MAG TPA: P-loop NTPase [Angustibacter sp.]|nr:P-loop NTPase [Angustibacter sp.]